jgi:two-component system, chemotaxis family, chemotaxis protein CheY
MAYNVLVVDDSAVMKSVIAKALEMSGVAVANLLRASDGREALGVMRSHWVDIVFADINMPVMNGLELVGEMKADDSLRSIPVVVISTEGSVARMHQLEQLGVRAFLRKPFPPEALKKTLESILGSRP